MSNTPDNQDQPKYWMSLEQWRQDPEFRALAEKEFLSSPLQDGEEGWARREFLKLMGASLALTSFGCVRRPAQKIIPYVKKPVEITHGLPNFYASSYADGYEGFGIVVTTRDGRPIKIEGNADHPATKGGMSARAHAHILKLYDPDRFTGPRRNLQNATRSNREPIGAKWPDLDKLVTEQLKKGKVAVMAGANLSPATQTLTDDFAAAFGAKQYQYDDVSYDSLAEAQKLSYGTAGLPRYRLEKAKLVVAINNDFIGTWLNPTEMQAQYVGRRRASADMNRLIVIESTLSLTGTNADAHHRIKPSESMATVAALLKELIVKRKLTRFAGDANVARTLEAFPVPKVDFDLAKIADELWQNRGQSVVLAGGLATDGEGAVGLQILTNLLNAALDNDGKTVDGVGATVVTAKGGFENIGALIGAMKAKQVSTLIIHQCNPFYSLPKSSGFREALANVEMVIYTGDRNDETARYADVVAVDHHSLENWGDMLSLDGTYSIQQPTIEPLHETRAYQDSLLAWMKGAEKGSAMVKASADWYEYLRAYCKNTFIKGGGDQAWNALLEKGIVPNTSKGPTNRAFAVSALSKVAPTKIDGDFELALYQTIGLGDGSLANVPWLQELPDPVTKITWDNYATFSPKDAVKLKLKEGTHVRLTVGDEKLVVPAHVQPGQADGVVGLAVGYGRDGAGEVADGVGVNAFALVPFKDGRRLTGAIGVKVEAIRGFTDLACTQGHHSMEGRQLVVEETLKDYVKSPGGSVKRTHMRTMWSEHAYPDHKWGMVIDLNTCTGCSACVIACQSENNIPTVGKKYVLEGREMQWLRIDRYYVGSPENPDVVHQPLPCMHCDNAPCETVCPVIATVHGEEGTNDMIYNRCVGTRYCSNNCPYKVRRFNWFNYSNDIKAPRNLALNPEVTVRFRGVMEKCTFCIHRIKAARWTAKSQDRPLKTDEFTTACAQSCPTGAITFGDLRNKDAKVTAAFDAPQSYPLLEELNTKPAVHYQVKVRNVDEMPGRAEPQPAKPAHPSKRHAKEGEHA